MRELELLSPAKNLECGKAAIDHGADAVYIGAQRFGARAAAGNSVADIGELCRYAHQFSAKVYVTVNTIIYDDELDATRSLLQELAGVGVDAVLVQDMGVMKMAREAGLTVHASTQTDNRTAEKVRWLSSLGCEQVVLARELSISEITEIHRQVPETKLEVFVHGALCVSYSGLCYASQHCFGRSANRGECAQFCRMKFDLLDAEGRVVEHDRYLLSLRDMNQLDNLEALADAGATSFKIEGRLKDVGYVKNVTAAYSQRLNEIIRRHPDRYCRSSRGHCTYTFTPNLDKTFNRGYTTYFAPGRQPDIASFDTPKALGEYVGKVKEMRRDSFNVAGTASFANGDGLCFFTANRELQGFRVNRVEGNRLYPQHMPADLRSGMVLYRSNDQAFDRLLSRPSAERKIPITMSLRATPDGFELSSDDTAVRLAIEHQTAEKPQRDNIVRQLTKLGGTPYECNTVDMPADFNYFIPSSQLAELRRRLVERIDERFSRCEVRGSRYEVRGARYEVRDSRCEVRGARCEDSSAAEQGLMYSRTSYLVPRTSNNTSRTSHLLNIANREACRFYGVEAPTAYELRPTPDAVLMQCRHCLRYALGYCVKHGGERPSWKEPLYLRLGDGRRFRLEFDCRNCQMNVYASTR